jgi:hypothetical protein
MRYKSALAACCTVLVGAVALAPSAASSAPDTTPPVVVTPVKASFTVGEQIDVGSPQECGDDPHDLRVYEVPLGFTWTGDDASGTVRYSLTGETGRDGELDEFVDSTQTSYAAPVGSNGDQSCGGGNGSVYVWHLTASDPAGNTVTHDVYGGRVRLTQDTDLTDRAGYATQPTITYAGRWGVSSCTCWSDGGVHRTTAKGASASITTASFSTFPAYVTNHHVGLVTEKGPHRGRFEVYVDGRRRTTVDLYATTSQPRTIVWQAGFLDYGHTIEVVNLATPGRPRVDLDAVLTN